MTFSAGSAIKVFGRGIANHPRAAAEVGLAVGGATAMGVAYGDSRRNGRSTRSNITMGLGIGMAGMGMGSMGWRHRAMFTNRALRLKAQSRMLGFGQKVLDAGFGH